MPNASLLGDEVQTSQEITVKSGGEFAAVPKASALAPSTASSVAPIADYKIIRRNGAVVGFEPSKISIAMTKAFLAVNGGQGAASARVRELVEQLTVGVVSVLMRRQPSGGTFHIEDVQDQVELALMRSGEHDVARAYVLYRAKRQEERAQQQAAKPSVAREQALHILVDGQRQPLDMDRLLAMITSACIGLEKHVDADAIVSETVRNLYDGVPVEELYKSAILAARALMEKDPAYSQVTARLLMHTIRKEVFGAEVAQADAKQHYIDYFPKFIKKGIEADLLDSKLAQFDLKKLAKSLVAERDLQFGYLGLQTLYDRYFLHIEGTRIEMPQAFYMRVAMGLALNEIDREARAIEFYNLLSTFDFMSSTPTLLILARSAPSYRHAI